MSDTTDAAELELTDAELVTVLENHGIDRRALMKVLGVGAGVAALGGRAAGGSKKGKRIDEVFGAPYARDETAPSGVVDHVVSLDVLTAADEEDEDEDEYEGFPTPDNEDEFVFDPVGLHVTPGDVVHFENLEHEHTVSAFHEKWNPIFPTRVPEGVPGFTSPPYVGGESWLYRFTTKGVYDLFCFPHLGFGMVMRVVVYDPEEDDIEDDTFDGWGAFPAPPEAGAQGEQEEGPEGGGETEGESGAETEGEGDADADEEADEGRPSPFANPERVLTNDALDPENIVERGEVAWAELDL